MKLLNDIIKKNLPTKQEQKKIQVKIDEFLDKIQLEIFKNEFKVEIVLGGSAAKGTFLKNDFDVDIFVRFDYGYKEEDLSKMLAKILKIFKPSLVHGSRDYFQVKNKGIHYEIIPVLKVEDPKKALNVTDMSPLHVQWVQKNMSAKLRKEVILAKLFCKANNLYGAESYIRGFSGHVLDVLIVYYGGFLKLLKASQKWSPKGKLNLYGIIDVQKHGTAKKLNLSKLSPLVVIDPIQPNRNAAAALGKDKLELFIEKSKDFLKKPSQKYFVKKKLTLTKLKKLKPKDSKLFVLNVMALTGKEDIVGAKLLKSHMHLLKQLDIHNFIVYNSGWAWDKSKKAMFWFFIDQDLLNKETLRTGPPVKAKNPAKSFKAKHKKAFVEDARLYAYVKRMFRTPDKLFNFFVKETYVKGKTKSAKLKVY